jgi:hypothetical protein
MRLTEVHKHKVKNIYYLSILERIIINNFQVRGEISKRQQTTTNKAATATLQR